MGYSQSIVNAKIISHQNDTLNVLAIHHKKSSKKSELFEQLEITDSNGLHKFLRPKQIKGFLLGNERYSTLSFYDSTEDKMIYAFTKVITYGKVSLYFTSRINGKQLDVYFFKKENEQYLHVFKGDELIDLGDKPYKIYAFNRDSVFRKYFRWYFKECLIISRKVDQGFYKSINLEIMMIDYNASCN